MADGYLTFDTRVDTKGFQASVSSLGRTAATAMKSVLTGVAIGVAAIALVASALITAFGALYKQMLKMDGFKNNVKGLELAFANLKNAAFSALMPLFNALLPIIMSVVAWLTDAVNSIAAFIAALTGADTYMVYVASSVKSAAGSAGDLADETERAGEAAKGALAGFDQLNILQQEKPSASSGGGGNAGAGSWIEMPVPEATSKWIDDVKKAFEDTKQWIGEHFVTPVAETATKLWNGIKEGAGLAYIGIKTGDWSGFNTWWDTEVAAPVKAQASITWSTIKEGAGLAWQGIKTGDWSGAAKWFEDHVLTPTLGYFNFTWEGPGGVKETINGILAPVKAAWIVISDWFGTNVLDPIAGAFGTTWTGPGGIAEQIQNARVAIQKDWQGVAQWFEDTVFVGIKNGWKLVVEAFTGGLQTGEVSIGKKLIEAVNSFAGSINTTFANIQRTINNWIASIKNVLGFLANGLDYINLPQISLLDTSSSSYFQDSPYPGLANGAVIPPNAPFAAVLGDQRSGKNIEAPLKTIEQAVENALARRGVGSTGGTISFDVDEAGLMRYLHPKFTAETKRVGNSLARKAGAA